MLPISVEVCHRHNQKREAPNLLCIERSNTQLFSRKLKKRKVSDLVTNISLRVHKMGLSLDTKWDIRELGEILPSPRQTNDEVDVLLLWDETTDWDQTERLVYVDPNDGSIA